MYIVEKDIIVAGGGIAGMCAAVAAARSGASVALINNRPVLGGNASTEIGVPINGAASLHYSPSVYAREGGIVSEITNYVAMNEQSDAMLDMFYLDFIYNEKNIELFLNTNVIEAETENNKIKSIRAFQLNSEREYLFKGSIFIDATGDGTVGAKSGAQYMKGRETKETFNESLAPDKADGYLMGSTVFWRSKDMGHEVKYTPPLFAHNIKDLGILDNIQKKLHRVMYGGGLDTLWWMEYGAQKDTIDENEEIVLELRKLVYGWWDYMKNSGEYDYTKNYLLTYVSPVPGKRESRRFVGDYVLNQNDILNKTHFDDAVSVGGWVFDSHAPLGIYDKGKASNWQTHRGTYNIPYRCLYSKNISNLMFAGRIMSTSHIAHGSTRVIGTGAAAAQATGTAAAMCVKYKTEPKNVNYSELQDTLQRNDQYILGRKEHYNENLIPDKIIATSESRLENTEFTKFIPLSEERYLALPIENGNVESAEIFLKNNGDEAVLEYCVYTGKLVESYLPTILLNRYSVKIEKGFCGYKKLELNAENLQDKKVYIKFLKHNSICLGVTEQELTGALSFTENDDPTAGIYIDGVGMKITPHENICFKNVLPNQNLYAAENLVNGYNRPEGLPYSWVSADKSDTVVELEYSEPKYVSEIQLIFNDNLKTDTRRTDMKTLIKDYFISVDDEITEVRDNILRVNKFSIGRYVKKIRIVPLSNYGAAKFEIFGIRIN